MSIREKLQKMNKKINNNTPIVALIEEIDISIT